MIRFRFPVVAALSGVAFVACVADAPRETAAAAISALRELGVRPVMLSGDSVATAQRVAAELEAGETQLNISRVDVAAFIKNLVGAFSHKALKKSLTVAFACCGAQPEDHGLLFNTDAEKLHRVLANLLANAIEYNNAGKTVRIEARKENDVLRVSIADEGFGVPKQERERLFDRFHQFDRGSTKKHKGHGLGLSTTKALVGMLGGKISVADAVGGGCVFHLAVPEAVAAGDSILSEDGNEFLFENEKRL